mmetsp:Transcript_4279/g.13345  ORF Transcript_4279/g.13345 Transcript_4279/m.13345 type:complete len:83 (+) Transcript_4279:986-1234(+)
MQTGQVWAQILAPFQRPTAATQRRHSRNLQKVHQDMSWDREKWWEWPQRMAPIMMEECVTKIWADPATMRWMGWLFACQPEV